MGNQQQEAASQRPAVTAPPTGVLTLAFTDIEGSSSLSERFGEVFEPSRTAHYRIVREELARFQGFEVHTAGDSLFAVFARPIDALQWAVGTQRTLAAYPWPMPVGEIRIRIGLYTGEPIPGDDNGRPEYYGPIPNRAARVSAAAHGGQILTDKTTYLLVDTMAARDGIHFQDLGTYRLKGIGEEQLFQIVAEGLVERFPPPNTLGTHQHNLPLPPTPFLGRESDVAALCALIEERKRLITLTGFGGLGKTRTAIHVAELNVDRFPGGVWWCDLSEARTRDAMLQKIGLDLNLDLQPPPSARDRIVGWLRDRKAVLLILDNLEQVEGAEIAVRELLSGLPDLVCLVTSRRRLTLQSETVYELGPLSPENAAALFVERARARNPAFTADADNANDIADLCRHLEGMPLALELAAARISALTPRQIVMRLSERFRLLQTKAPDLPERQRALRAAIDWSFNLLDDDLRYLFAQLSVFTRSGFTLDDAEAVCDSFDTLEGIVVLREHSLLVAETDTAAQVTRYFLLESLREYAAEKLRERPIAEGYAVQERHARHYLQRAEAELARLRTAEESFALATLERIADELRGAEKWSATEQGDHVLHARLSLSLASLLARRGFSRDAMVHAESGLTSARAAADCPVRLLAQLHQEIAGLHLDLRQPEAAREHLRAARAAMPRLDPVSEFQEENLLGHASLLDGDYGSTRQHFQRALDLSRANSAPVVQMAMLLNNLGMTESQDPNGDRGKGIALLTEALGLRRNAGDLRGIAATLNNLGTFAYSEQDWPGAIRYFTEALTSERAIQNTLGVALALNNLGEALEQSQASEAALRCYAAGLHLLQESGSPYADYVLTNLDRLAVACEFPSAEREALLASPRGKNLEAISNWALSSQP